MGAQKPPSDLTHMRHRRHYICPEIFPKPSRNLPEILRNLIKRLSRGWPVRTYGEAGALARSRCLPVWGILSRKLTSTFVDETSTAKAVARQGDALLGKVVKWFCEWSKKGNREVHALAPQSFSLLPAWWFEDEIWLHSERFDKRRPSGCGWHVAADRLQTVSAAF